MKTVLLKTFLTLLAFLKNILDAEKNRSILYVYYTVRIPNVLYLNYLCAFYFNHLYFLGGTAYCY